MKRIEKVLISVFIILNLCTVIRANVPYEIAVILSKIRLPYRVNYSLWLDDQYAYAAGLDNRWEMFSYMPHFNWWYTIEAKFQKEPLKKLLPLPLQVERTLLEKDFFDFREMKFHLNIYQSAYERSRYAKYLCRHSYGGPIESISFTLNWQNIVDRETAASIGTHLHPVITHQFLEEVKC